MTNKRNTYLLLASVVVIWGLIIYKMVNAISPDKKTTETEVVLTDFIPQKLEENPVFEISEHHRDPFLGTFPIRKKKNIRSGKQKPVPKEKAAEILVTFSGMISGNSAKEHIFFVSINKQQHVMRINDEIQKVKLVKGNANSIGIRYDNRFKTIPLTQ